MREAAVQLLRDEMEASERKAGETHRRFVKEGFAKIPKAARKGRWQLEAMREISAAWQSSGLNPKNQQHASRARNAAWIAAAVGAERPAAERPATQRPCRLQSDGSHSRSAQKSPV